VYCNSNNNTNNNSTYMIYHILDSTYYVYLLSVGGVCVCTVRM